MGRDMRLAPGPAGSGDEGAPLPGADAGAGEASGGAPSKEGRPAVKPEERPEAAAGPGPDGTERSGPPAASEVLASSLPEGPGQEEAEPEVEREGELPREAGPASPSPAPATASDAPAPRARIRCPVCEAAGQAHGDEAGYARCGKCGTLFRRTRCVCGRRRRCREYLPDLRPHEPEAGDGEGSPNTTGSGGVSPPLRGRRVRR